LKRVRRRRRIGAFSSFVSGLDSGLDIGVVSALGAGVVTCSCAALLLLVITPSRRTQRRHADLLLLAARTLNHQPAALPVKSHRLPVDLPVEKHPASRRIP